MTSKLAISLVSLGIIASGTAVVMPGPASASPLSSRVEQPRAVCGPRGLPAAQLLRRAAFRINAAALLRRLYAAPLLRWLCLCPIETAPVWIYNSALLRRGYGWISIGAMGSPEIQTMRGEGAQARLAKCDNEQARIG